MQQSRAKTARAQPARHAPVTPRPEAAFPSGPLLALLAVTGAVFWRMLGHELTNWDDQAYVLDNALLRGPDWTAIFTRPFLSNYHPLTLVTLALNYQAGGVEPFGYLLVNWALHLVNVALVCRFAWVLSDHRPWVAVFTALVFALHPMHVESVAWVSERKDVLYTAFYLLALLVWWRYLERRRRLDYGLTLGCFVLALLSKPAAVILPVVLLLLDWWRARPVDRTLWLDKVPFFGLSLAFGLLTVSLQSTTAIASWEEFSPIDRLLFGCWGLVAYLLRFFVPWPLSAFHPYPAPGQADWAVRLSPVALALLGAALWRWRRERALVFGAGFYTANLLLAVQFFAVGYTLLSERYTYVPYIGLAFALGMLLEDHVPALRTPTVRWGVAGALAAMLAAATVPRVAVWRDADTLWSDVVRTYPGTPIPHTNLATHLYRQALAMPDPEAARALLARARANADAALRADPRHLKALDVRSLVHLQLGRPDAALADADTMIAAAPNDPKGHLLRGSAAARLEQWDEALGSYGRALDLDPADAEAWRARGIALFNGKKAYREALDSFDRALALAPDGRTYLARSRTHLILGQRQEAIRDARSAAERGVPVPDDYWALLARE